MQLMQIVSSFGLRGRDLAVVGEMSGLEDGELESTLTAVVG